MMRFGPSGNCQAFYDAGLKHTFEEPKWLSEMGLNAFEYSFGLGRFLNTDTAVKIGTEAKKYGVEVSVHAPYYINFANMTDAAKVNNPRFLLESLRNLHEMGGRHCVVHIGAQMKFSRDEALENIRANFGEFLKMKNDSEYRNLYVCPEAMGKYTQIGTFREVFEICTWDQTLIPTLDFGHINCILQGGLRAQDDFYKILKEGIDTIGRDKMNDLHIHFSKIMYNAKGEVKHLTFDDDIFGPNFEPMLDAIVDLKLNPVIICESSGTQARDALAMSKYYQKSK